MVNAANIIVNTAKASKYISIYAPTGGLNTLDPIADMDKKEAYVLTNILPAPGYAIPRQGFQPYATNVGNGPVNSIFEVSGGTINKMIACSGSGVGNCKFYDVTTEGDAVEIESGSGPVSFDSSVWSGAFFNGKFYLVNGVDTPQVYDGSTLEDATLSSSDIDIKSLNYVFPWKGRLYFCANSNQSFFFSDEDSVTGVLTEGSLANISGVLGNLIAIQSYSTDGGSGQQDLICFFMDDGQIIIYGGSDPDEGSPPETAFNLLGVYKAGRPINPRAIKKWGADIFMVNDDGYATISKMLPLSFGKTNEGVTKNIQGLAQQYLSTSPNLFGWEVTLATGKNLLIVNVPTQDNSFVQHVLQLNTLKWCTFEGIPSRCWCIFDSIPYFGSSIGEDEEETGIVYSYGPNYVDKIDVNVDSVSIKATYTSPYMNFNQRPARVNAIRPRLRFDNPITILISTSSDFKSYTTPFERRYLTQGISWGFPWNSPTPAWGYPWDSPTPPWSTSSSIQQYVVVYALGTNLSFSFNFFYVDYFEFFGIDVLYEKSNRI